MWWWNDGLNKFPNQMKEQAVSQLSRLSQLLCCAGSTCLGHNAHCRGARGVPFHSLFPCTIAQTCMQSQHQKRKTFDYIPGYMDMHAITTPEENNIRLHRHACNHNTEREYYSITPTCMLLQYQKRTSFTSADNIHTRDRTQMWLHRVHKRYETGST